MTYYLPRAFARFNAGVNAARIEYARTLAELEEQEPLPPPAACGTYGGYRKHYRQKTEVCDACREAYNAVARKRYAKKKEGRT